MKKPKLMPYIYTIALLLVPHIFDISLYYLDNLFSDIWSEFFPFGVLFIFPLYYNIVIFKSKRAWNTNLLITGLLGAVGILALGPLIYGQLSDLVGFFIPLMFISMAIFLLSFLFNIFLMKRK